MGCHAPDPPHADGRNCDGGPCHFGTDTEGVGCVLSAPHPRRSCRQRPAAGIVPHRLPGSCSSSVICCGVSGWVMYLYAIASCIISSRPLTSSSCSIVLG